jgi:signal transduction histidine kinase
MWKASRYDRKMTTVLPNDPFVSAALDTIEEAIGIYDADDCLVGFNRNYITWRAAIGGNPMQGARWGDLVQASVEAGSIPEAIGREDDWLERRRRARGAYSIVRKLADGRSFRVNERRMANGGIAVVWTDVSSLITAQADRAAAATGGERRLQAVGRVTSGIMHDFNNINAATIGGLQLLRKRLPMGDAAVARLLERTLQSAQRGAALSRRLLAVGRQSQQKADVHLAELVQGLDDLFSSALGQGVKVEKHFPPTLPPVHIDAAELEMAILNLAINARDAMAGAGRLIIAARAHQVGQTGSNAAMPTHVILSMTDTGPGMDEATLARAVDPFFTTKAEDQGTGLGLSMMHAFAVQCGGKFLLHSARGIGTTAELWLPCYTNRR